MGHNHTGHKYIGGNLIGHNYIGHNHIGHNYIGHNYKGNNNKGGNLTGLDNKVAQVERQASGPHGIEPERLALVSLLFLTWSATKDLLHSLFLQALPVFRKVSVATNVSAGCGDDGNGSFAATVNFGVPYERRGKALVTSGSACV